MRSILLIFILSGLCCLYSGCTATGTHSSMKSKAARMSPELLRSQVLQHKALVEDSLEEERMVALAQIFDNLAPRDTPYTAEVAKSVSKALQKNPEMKEWNTDFQENVKNYQFFYKKLKEKSGDMTGLELDLPYDYNHDHIELILPPQKNYEKPLFPPIQETPAPYSEPKTKEAV